MQQTEFTGTKQIEKKYERHVIYRISKLSEKDKEDYTYWTKKEKRKKERSSVISRKGITFLRKSESNQGGSFKSLRQDYTCI